MKLLGVIAFSLALSTYSFGQTIIDVYVDSVQSAVGSKFEPGVFYVPKTTEAQTDFLGNGIRQNSIRLNIIEGAMNNTTNLTDCIAYLDAVSTIIQDLSAKTDELLFIFEKMPVWLSSSSDGSPASTPGWFVLNTKPPANYANWNAAVTGIVDRIVNTYNINNASFEIWNEPDLGSWTGTKAEFFELFKHTYDAIKSVDQAIPTGGPATNHWGKNINYQQPYGYLNDSIADLSLIGELIDSTTSWNKPLDFISWHNFNLEHQTNQNAIDYITQKYGSLGLSLPELMVSEWNTPSVIRDTPLQTSFFVKSQLEMAKTSINYNMVAAWQDFSQSSNEFHNDYGLLTYGSIHKPAYKALLLTNKLAGDIVKTTTTLPTEIITTVSNDTLNVLIANYVPPAFVEAFNQTLFDGQFTADQLEAAGYIDLATNNFSSLDSIYRGLVLIPNTSAINSAINNTIPTYAHFTNFQTANRSFVLNVDGILGSHTGISYTVDSIENNSQFTYDSLILQGITQTNAIANVTTSQVLVTTNVSLSNGQITFSMAPNSVRLFQFFIPELVSLSELSDRVEVFAFPNPTSYLLRVESSQILGEIIVSNSAGKIVSTSNSPSTTATIDFSAYQPGMYFVHLPDCDRTLKVVRD